MIVPEGRFSVGARCFNSITTVEIILDSKTGVYVRVVATGRSASKLLALRLRGVYKPRSRAWILVIRPTYLVMALGRGRGGVARAEPLIWMTWRCQRCVR